MGVPLRDEPDLAARLDRLGAPGVVGIDDTEAPVPRDRDVEFPGIGVPVRLAHGTWLHHQVEHGRLVALEYRPVVAGDRGDRPSRLDDLRVDAEDVELVGLGRLWQRARLLRGRLVRGRTTGLRAHNGGHQSQDASGACRSHRLPAAMRTSRILDIAFYLLPSG